MFCRNCGAQLEDSARFCVSCGTPTGDVATNKENPQGRKESVVVQVPQRRQQETSMRYQKMGWAQIGLQEVAKPVVWMERKKGKKAKKVELGEPYVNLTFERNTGIKNFDRLNQIYTEYRTIEEDYIKKEHEWTQGVLQDRTVIYLMLLVTAIGLIWVVSYWFNVGFSFFIALLTLSLDFIVAALVSIIASPIVGVVRKSKAKKKYASLVSQYEEKMTALAYEAEQYLF